MQSGEGKDLMKNHNASLFIDANQYLNLYRVHKSKETLLRILRENQAYIFITKQIADEVQRNKLGLAQSLVNTIIDQLIGKPTTFVAHEHFFRSDSTVTNLYAKIVDLQKTKRQLEPDLTNEVFQVLEQVSQSEDEVSRALAELFKKSVVHTAEELQRAKDRRDRGNPPGKPNGPLGDQLNWEQLLSHCKQKSKIWLVSADSDYCIEHDKKRILNAFLQQDLVRMNQPPPQMFCFDNLLDAIEDFASQTGVEPSTPLTQDESQEIKDELDSLPPFGFDGPEHGVRGFDEGYWTSDHTSQAVKLLYEEPSGAYQLKKMFDELPQEKLRSMFESLPGQQLAKMFSELPSSKIEALFEARRKKQIIG